MRIEMSCEVGLLVESLLTDCTLKFKLTLMFHKMHVKLIITLEILPAIIVSIFVPFTYMFNLNMLLECVLRGKLFETGFTFKFTFCMNLWRNVLPIVFFWQNLSYKIKQYIPCDLKAALLATFTSCLM